LIIDLLYQHNNIIKKTLIILDSSGILQCANEQGGTALGAHLAAFAFII
jgi:hypothetical protein